MNKFRCYYNDTSFKKLTNGKCLLLRTVVQWILKLAEHNMDIKNRVGKENIVAYYLSRNPQECMEIVYKVNNCVLSTLILRLRVRLIQEQKKDSEFVGMYRYFHDSDEIGSLNAAFFEKCSQSFKLIHGLFSILMLLTHEENLQCLFPIIFVKFFLGILW